MRVLHVLEGMYYGGSEVHVLTNCKAAKFADHAIYSLVPAPGGDICFSHKFLEAGIPIYYDNFSELRQDFDVVHVYGATQHDPPSMVADNPAVWTMTFNTSVAKVDIPLLCTSFKTLTEQHPENEAYLYRCAVDLEEFTPMKRVSHYGVNLIRVCRPGKSELMLDEVVAEILDNYEQCTYYVIGDREGVDHPRIYYLGTVEDIMPYISIADLFVYAPKIPSACTCDICVIEAMAMGLPVVATRAWQVTEQISHGVTGIFVDYDKSSMYTAIDYLVRRAEERTRLGDNAYARARDLFDIESRMPLLQTVYEQVVVTGE